MEFSFTEELRWRGMLHDITPGTEELLNSSQVNGYIGFDPTSDYDAAALSEGRA